MHVADDTKQVARCLKRFVDVTKANFEAGLGEILRLCGRSIRFHEVRILKSALATDCPRTRTRGEDMQTTERFGFEGSASSQRTVLCTFAQPCSTTPAINEAADIFESHRSRLFGVAYRMLRTRADAEDVVQDAYLRWHETKNDIQSPIGFLITVTTRLCLDRLRHSKKEREQLMETWLPDAIDEDHVPSPEEQFEIAEEVSVAFLAVLERLGSEERAAFLLREVFDYDYPEVAQVVDKSESACRQLIHRSRAHLRDPRARFAVTPECRERVLKKFIAAITTCDRKAVQALLAEEIEYAPRARP
jgi:RNA polymerase sigma factor (sigma-70 family)